MSKKSELVELKPTATALAVLPADIDFAADMQDFGANYSQEQLAMPFLSILQALSPQVTRGKEGYMADAKVGEFFNSVTKERYDGEKGINMILSTFKESYIEWVPRNKGGGFVAEHDPVAGLRAKTVMDPDFNQVIQDNSPVGTPGNFLSLTHTRLGAIVNADLTGWTPVIISLSASGLKVSRNINSRHQLMEWKNPVTGEPGPLGRCPMPLILWNVKSKIAQNKNGDTWFTWDFEKKSFLYDLPQEQFLSLYRSIREFAGSTRGKAAMDNAAEELAKNVTPDTTLDDTIPF